LKLTNFVSWTRPGFACKSAGAGVFVFLLAYGALFWLFAKASVKSGAPDLKLANMLTVVDSGLSSDLLFSRD